MIDVDAEIAIVGSGFAGSLSALILHQAGRRVVLIDNGVHPRFAIGESSTPIANMVLGDLARKYDLPRVAPLAKYGHWRATYPQIACGLKRGFSYFRHEPGRRFQPTSGHTHELMVTASPRDEVGDTHWYRADVDAFLAGEVRAAGVPFLDATCISAVSDGDEGKFLFAGQRENEPVRIRAGFVIDATGGGGFLRRHLRLADQAANLQTCSRALYGHFRRVPRWHDVVDSAGVQFFDEHPFDCDASAMHHLLDGGWMWLLRFDNGVTSVGLMVDDARFPLDESVPVDVEWANWLCRYPDLQKLLSAAELADPPGRLVRTGRLQRIVSQSVGRNWALLPHAAGFIDPLHSTGIAHSLCAVEQLVEILETDTRQGRFTDSPQLQTALKGYQQRMTQEFALIDRLVRGCYQTLRDFRLFTAISMVYFAAATTYEHRRADNSGGHHDAFLCADDKQFCSVVQQLAGELDRLLSQGAANEDAIAQFERATAAAVAPFNRVGLCDPAVNNMYRYTAAPVD
jgi:FADH2 O2-dependent halogenase